MPGPAIALVPAVKVAAPYLIKWGARSLLLAKAAWFGKRLVENEGDLAKTFTAMWEDVKHTFMFLTDAQYRGIQRAGKSLKEKGGDYANIAGLLLSLAEIVTGTKLTNAKAAVEKSGQILSAYKKLSPAEQAEVDAHAEQDLEATLNEALSRYLFAEGVRIVAESREADNDASAYLSSYYRGLYCIGRSGNRFAAEDIDSFATYLQNYHESLGTPEHAALADWYAAIGVTTPAGDLSALLAACPEVAALGVDARYIAYALNQKDPELTFGGILEEIMQRFPDINVRN